MKVRESAFIVVAVLAWTPVASAAPLPSRIAGIGDSITRATDVCCCTETTQATRSAVILGD